MANNKEIKKVVKKDKFQKLKYLSHWLMNPYKPMDILIENYAEFNNNLKYRLFNNVLNSPKVCWYINQYLNGLVDFHSAEYLPEDWLITFADILRINKYKNFYFSKYQNLKRNQFTKLLNDYLLLCNYPIINQEEINNLFLLFEHNILTQEYIENFQLILAGKDVIHKDKDKSSKSNFVNLISSSLPTSSIVKSADITNFCNIINNTIINKNTCKSCVGYRKGNIIIDTNVEKLGLIDVNVICNVSPTKEDIKEQTFLADNLQFKNYLIETFNKYKLTYTFTNKVLCYNNITDAPSIKKVVSTCAGMNNLVTQSFQSKITIVLGAKVAKELGIKSFAKQIGNLVNDQWFILNHPDELSTKNINIEKQIENLNNILSKLSFKTSSTTAVEAESDKNLLITNKNISNFTLFDIQIIGNKVIYIVLDKDNNKQYIINEFNFPIHIKYGNFKECSYISDKVDFIAYVNSYEKRGIQDKLLQNLKSEILKQNINTGSIEEDESENNINYDQDEAFNEMF